MKILHYSLVILLLLVSACSSEAPVIPTKVGTNVWPGYEPLYLARANERLDPEAVQLVEYPSSSEVIRSFRNGSLDAAALTLDEVLLLLQSEIPVKVVLVMDISEGGDAILARPEISSFNELRGKRIAVEGNALGAYVISRALELNQMSLDDVQIKNIEVSAHLEAYSKNRVDAVVTFDPVRTSLLNQGANEIFTSREIPGEIVDVLVVHEEYLRNNPARIRHIVQAWFETLNFMENQKEEAMQIIAKRLFITAEEVEASYHGLILPGLDKNRQLLTGATPAMGTTLQRLEQTMLANDLLMRDLDTTRLLSGEMLE